MTIPNISPIPDVIPVPGIFEDLRSAIDKYATENCKTEILFALPADHDRVNLGEVFPFTVKVTNKGQLDMKNVKVRAMGTADADVSLSSPAAVFGPSAVSQAFDLEAHQSHTTGNFRLKAKAVTNGAKDIVTARIDVWDATLDHILRDHSGVGAAEGPLNIEIHPPPQT